MIDEYKDMDVFLGRPLLNKVEKIGRNISRFFPHKKYKRENGITALVLLRDEPLAYVSVESILPFVDEVVVVDCGKVAAKLPEDKKIRYIHTPPEQDSQVKIGLLLSRYRWILRWDGDFLTTVETKKVIEKVRAIKDGYWQVKCMVANVHDGKVKMLQKESYLFTYHPYVLMANHTYLKDLTDGIAKMRGGLPGRICYGTLPYFFGQIDLDMVLADHYYKTKSTYRLIERKYQAYWSLMDDHDRLFHKDFECFVKKMEEWSG